MVKIIVLQLIFSLIMYQGDFALPMYAQQQTSGFRDISVIDSLSELLTTGDERKQAYLHNQLTFEYFYISLDKARFHQHLAQSLGEKYADNAVIANAILNDAFISRLEGNLPRSIELSKAALQIYRRSSDKRGVARALYNLGLAHGSRNDYISARKALLESLDTAEEAKDSFQLARTLNAVAEDYFAIGEPAKGLEYSLRSLEYHKNLPDKRWLALQLDNVGFLYENMDKGEKALEYYEEAFRLLVSLGRKGKHRLANSCKNIANALRKLRRFDEALIWAQKGIDIQLGAGEVFKSLNGLRGNYRAMAEIYEEQNSLDSAIFWNKAILAQKIPLNQYTLSIYEALVRLSGKKKNPSESRLYAEKAWNLGHYLGTLKAIETAARIKAESMRISGYHDSAYYFLARYVAVHDSLNSIEKKRQIERMQAAHDIDKSIAENERLRQENVLKEAVIARQTSAVIAVSVSLLASILLAVLISRANKRNRQNSERLQVINHELDTTLHELKQTQSQLVLSERVSAVGMLTAGVMHEINNPNAAVYAALESLQSTNKQMQDFFLTLLDDESKESPEAKRFTTLGESAQKMIAIALAGSERVKNIVASLRTFTKHQEDGLKKAPLLQELFTTTEIFRYQFKQINVEINVPPELTITGNIAEINQVFLNLLVNAAQAGASEIRITAQDALEGSVFIRVQDNGKGMDVETQSRIFEPFYSTKEAGNSGLGLSISRQILERHSAEMSVKSEPGRGTEFVIEFPKS